MKFGPYVFEPNDQVTRAFDLLKRGEREKAIKVIADEGYPDAEHQVKLIEGFILHMKNWKEKDAKPRNTQNDQRSFKRQVGANRNWGMRRKTGR